MKGMSGIATPAEKIVDFVEDSKSLKGPLIRYCLEQIYYTNLIILEQLAKNHEISVEECYKSQLELKSRFSPYLQPRTMAYYEATLGNEAIELIEKFLVIEEKK